MAEPQPSNVQEGTDQPDVLPANAEDRKAAKAMSSLDARGDEDEGKPKNNVDMKAISDAMKNLGVSSGGDKKPAAGAAGAKKEETKPLLKVDPKLVTLVSEQLDMGKVKATELLRQHEGDAVKAMTAWVTSAV